MIRFIIKFAIFFIAALLLTFLWSKIAGAAEADAAQHRRIEAFAWSQRLSSLEAVTQSARFTRGGGRSVDSEDALVQTVYFRTARLRPGRTPTRTRRTRSITARETLQLDSEDALVPHEGRRVHDPLRTRR